MTDDSLPSDNLSTLAELAQSIRARMGVDHADNPHLATSLRDDVRFYILVRLAQKYSREEILAELLGWGWPERHARELVKEAFEQRRNTNDPLVKQAIQLAEREGMNYRPELAFDATETTSHSRSFFEVNYAKWILYGLLLLLLLILAAAYFLKNDVD